MVLKIRVTYYNELCTTNLLTPSPENVSNCCRTTACFFSQHFLGRRFSNCWGVAATWHISTRSLLQMSSPWFGVNAEKLLKWFTLFLISEVLRSLELHMQYVFKIWIWVFQFLSAGPSGHTWHFACEFPICFALSLGPRGWVTKGCLTIWHAGCQHSWWNFLNPYVESKSTVGQRCQEEKVLPFDFRLPGVVLRSVSNRSGVLRTVWILDLLGLLDSSMCFVLPFRIYDGSTDFVLTNL